MSRIKAEAESIKRGTLNTTIRNDVLTEFKQECKRLNLPMNILLESFMRQFCDNEFTLKFGKNNQIEVDIEDSKE